MITWKSLPGNWDALHSRDVFPSDNEYGIPTIEKNMCMPSQLIQWGSRPQLFAVKEESNTAVHFFIDDYRFECLWRSPVRSVNVLMHVGQALSPDFSLFRDMPLAMQIWNTYRNRWLACYWQSYGLSVIPTISWSKPYDFCYFGVPQGSIIAVSSVGLGQDKTAHYLFRDGFEKMIDVLKPESILLYGKLPSDIQPDVPITTFPTRWEQRKTQPTSMHMNLSLWEA